MSNRARPVLQAHERHVRHIRHNTASNHRGDVTRRFSEPVPQDRKVMRPEIPNNARVRLVQTEVHATRGDEVDLSEFTTLNEFTDGVHRWAVEKRVARHKSEP